jgi:hypothetical protein
VIAAATEALRSERARAAGVAESDGAGRRGGIFDPDVRSRNRWRAAHAATARSWLGEMPTKFTSACEAVADCDAAGAVLT